jgi:hypothetical protein
MGEINLNLYKWITAHQGNPLVMGFFTFCYPSHLIRSIYEANLKRPLWGNHKACFTLSFDCDFPDDVHALPDLLTVLAKHRLKASFACVGAWIERFPREHALILEYGHEIVNHTYSHPDNELLNPGRRFRYISREEKKEEIERCHEVCSKILHYEPKGCRIPHFKNLFTEEIYGILVELGYTYSSSTWLTNTLSHGLPFEAAKDIVEFPLSTCPKHPFTVFDTWHSLNTPRLAHRLVHRGPEQYKNLFKKLLHLGLETGSYLNIYIDPLDVKQIPAFESILELLSDGAFLVRTYEEYMNNNLFVEKFDR